MTRHGDRFARRLRLLSAALLLYCLFGWTPTSWATNITCAPSTDFVLPSFGTIVVPPDASAGATIGPQEQVTISFQCTNLPNNTTVSIIASNFGSPDNYQAAATNAVMLQTSVAGIDLELAADSLSGTFSNNTFMFAGAMSLSNSTITATVTGRLIKTQAGPIQVQSPLVSKGALFGTFTAEPNNGNGNNGVILSNQLTLQPTTVISAPTCDALVVPTPVVLPTVSVRSLASGQTAGATAFKIMLSGCPTSLATAAAYFEPGATIDSATGNLKNRGTAANVEVQLLNGSGGSADAGSAIGLGAADGAQNSGKYPVTGGAATMNYYARYVANGATAGAGSVQTSVKFTLEYP